MSKDKPHRILECADCKRREGRIVPKLSGHIAEVIKQHNDDTLEGLYQGEIDHLIKYLETVSADELLFLIDMISASAPNLVKIRLDLAESLEFSVSQSFTINGGTYNDPGLN